MEDLRSRFHNVLSDQRATFGGRPEPSQWGGGTTAPSLNRLEQNLLHSSRQSAQPPPMAHAQIQPHPQPPGSNPHYGQGYVTQQQPSQWGAEMATHPYQYQPQPPPGYNTLETHQGVPQGGQQQVMQKPPDSSEGGIISKLSSMKMYILIAIILAVVAVCAYFGYRWYTGKTKVKEPPPPGNQWLQRAGAPPPASSMRAPQSQCQLQPAAAQPGSAPPFGVPNPPPASTMPPPSTRHPQQQPQDHLTQHGSGAAEENDPNFTKLSALR
jgi:hypothetical protein